MAGIPLVQNNDISIYKTNPEDLEAILEIENAPENKMYIRQWSQETHLGAIFDDNYGHLTVKQNSNNEIIGYIILVGLTEYDKSLHFKRFVIQSKGRGYGRAVFQLIMKIAFENFEMHRIWLEVLDYNEAGCHIYLTEGFKKEGIHRQSYFDGTEYHDLIAMSILEPEYKEIHK